MLYRLLHYAETVIIQGKSHSVKNQVETHCISDRSYLSTAVESNLSTQLSHPRFGRGSGVNGEESVCDAPSEVDVGVC